MTREIIVRGEEPVTETLAEAVARHIPKGWEPDVPRISTTGISGEVRTVHIPLRRKPQPKAPPIDYCAAWDSNHARICGNDLPCEIHAPLSAHDRVCGLRGPHSWESCGLNAPAAPVGDLFAQVAARPETRAEELMLEWMDKGGVKLTDAQEQLFVAVVAPALAQPAAPPQTGDAHREPVTWVTCDESAKPHDLWGDCTNPVPFAPASPGPAQAREREMESALLTMIDVLKTDAPRTERVSAALDIARVALEAAPTADRVAPATGEGQWAMQEEWANSELRSALDVIWLHLPDLNEAAEGEWRKITAAVFEAWKVQRRPAERERAEALFDRLMFADPTEYTDIIASALTHAPAPAPRWTQAARELMAVVAPERHAVRTEFTGKDQRRLMIAAEKLRAALAQEAEGV